MLAFPPFRLDLDEERLWKGNKLLVLRRKPFAILRYLATNPRRLVTHDELLKQVWGGSVVSESAVRSHLHDLRQALGEGVIETVIGRGYRFAAPIADDASAANAASTASAASTEGLASEPIPASPATAVAASSAGATGAASAAPAAPAAPTAAMAALPLPRAAIRPERVMVGRTAELATLRAALDRAASGQRQVCVVSGDPGIGKTTLVDAFLDELEDRGVLAVRGQCVEQFGTPEAYLAMIEVIGRLRRSERGEHLLGAFVRCAPTFLARVPHLVPDEQHADLARRAQGGTEARVARELAEALELASAHDALVIVLEDLQWSDLATIDLLALLAQRSERARLMVIATARRAAVQTSEHPLGRTLRPLLTRGAALPIALERIDGEGVRELIDRRFAGHRFPDKLVDVVGSITGGTPLFLVSFLGDLVGRGMLADRGGWALTVSVDEVAAHRPDSIKQLIDIQLDRLGDDEQRVLEAASLVGAVFSTGPVAAALAMPVERVDDLCDALARRALFLRREASEESPDGALYSRYAVTHALVQEVCEERGSPARRQRWHGAIADYLERTYAGRTAEIAHVLAAHLDKARAPARAIDHYIVAGHQTALRFAALDAVASYERAHELLAKLPRTPDRDALELKILATIGQLLIRTPYGRGDPIHVYQRTIELAREVGDVPSQYVGLANLCLRHVVHSELALATEVGEELAALAADRELDPQLVEYGTNVRALTALYLGELTRALGWFEALAGSTAKLPPDGGLVHRAALHGANGRASMARADAALVLCLLGAPDRALAEARRAVAEAARIDDPIGLAITENMLTRVQLFRRDPVADIERSAHATADRGTAGYWVLRESKLLVAWAESHRVPLTAAAAATIADDYRTRLSSESLGAPLTAVPIADMLARSGFHAEARDVVDRAIAYAIARDVHLCLPDIVCARGDLLAASDPAAAAVAYRDAHARATARQMWLFALRAGLRLSRLGAAERSEARGWIEDALAHCAEPSSSAADFVEARALLA